MLERYLTPPPMPPDLATWLQTRIVGRPVIEAAWRNCFLSGVGVGVTLASLVILFGVVLALIIAAGAGRRKIYLVQQ